MHTFEIAITDYCNLDCALCSQGTPIQKNKKTMTMEEIVRVSRHIAPFEFQVIKISGGEPTLHPQFAQICDELRNLFKANRYELATNGFRLEKFLDRLHVFDAVYLSRYPGKNDEIIEKFEQLKIPNINIATKTDYDTMEDVHQHKNLNKTRIFEHCPYTFPKLVQGRIYACCVIFGQSIRQNINLEEISVPMDENWRQNLKQINIERYCRQCFVDVKAPDAIFSEPVKVFPEISTTGFGLPASIKNEQLIRLTESKPQRKGLTIFALPKAFKGNNAVIQHNAIKSWTQLLPKPEIILMGSDAGVAEYAAELGLRHIADVRKNEFGTPLVSDIFGRAQEAATNDVLMYINSDIILMDDFQIALNKVRERFNEFLMVGQRWDIDIDSEINFDSPDWQEQLRKSVYQRGALFSVCGIDYFTFTRGIWPAIPDFGIGRTVWDNWLVWKPTVEGKVVVDATEAVMAVHQNHEYVPSPSRLNEESVNRDLSEKFDSFGFTSYTVWKCTPAGVAMRHPSEFFSKSDWAGGIAYIEKALSQDPATMEKWCHHAVACMTPEVLKILAGTAKDLLSKRPSHSGAAMVLKCITEKSCSIGEVMLRRGNEYLRDGNFDEALKWFDVLTGLDVPNINYAMAQALSRLGKFLAAKQACLDELKLQPGHNDAQMLLEAMDAELKIEANDLCMKGLSKLQQNNFTEALIDFESVAQRTGFAVPNLNYAKAVTLSRLGKFFAAKQACLDELKLQPGHAGAAKMLEMLNTAIVQNITSNVKNSSGATNPIKEVKQGMAPYEESEVFYK